MQHPDIAGLSMVVRLMETGAHEGKGHGDDGGVYYGC